MVECWWTADSKTDIENVKRNIKSGKVKSWVELHNFTGSRALLILQIN